MKHNPENEDILDQAEAIFEESKQDVQAFSVTLIVDDAILILSAPFEYLQNHKESDGETETAKSLMERFEEVLTLNIEQNQSVTDNTISLELNARDVDFINGVLFDRTGFFRQAGKSTMSSNIRELTSLGANNAMAAIIRLNTAFVNAGGQPRPDFTRFRDGIEPNK